MVSLGTYSHTTSSNLVSFTTIAGAEQFSTDLSSTSPNLTSTISFTVQSSINGYTIHCVDAGGVDTKSCTVDIAGAHNSVAMMLFMIIHMIFRKASCIRSNTLIYSAFPQLLLLHLTTYLLCSLQHRSTSLGYPPLSVFIAMRLNLMLLTEHSLLLILVSVYY